jgi:RecB family endonuclease NucS
VNSETGRTEIRVWTLKKDRLRLLEETPFASQRLERDLEIWLEKNPDLLGRDLLVIGRQVSTTSGPLDLLAIDESGALHIIELKRSMLPREAVAQALDYAAWLNSTFSRGNYSDC